MNFKQICEQRYATKKFSGEMLPEDKIEELKEMIRLAPSSFGLLPFKVKVVTDKETKEKLLPASWNQPQITTCSHVLIFCADNNIMDYINRLEQMLIAKNTPQENIDTYVGMMKGFVSKMSKEELTTWAAKQAYIALSHAMNGAKALGFDSCPMEGFDASQYSEILNLDENLTPVVVCPVGIAADTPRPKMRFPKEEIFF